MYFELTLFNALTVCVIVATIWLMRYRFTASLDSNYPLIYYVALVLYVRAYEGEYYNYAIFSAAVAALFLRFEFMGGIFLKFFRAAELLCHCYIVYRAFTLINTR